MNLISIGIAEFAFFVLVEVFIIVAVAAIKESADIGQAYRDGYRDGAKDALYPRGYRRGRNKKEYTREGAAQEEANGSGQEGRI